MLKRLLFFIFYFFMCFPVPTIAVQSRDDVRPLPIYVGTYIRGQVLSCYKKSQLETVLNPKTSHKAARLLFKSPYPCSISMVEVYIDELIKKFKDADGNYFWIAGVSGDEEPGTQFYIVLPARDLKRAP